MIELESLKWYIKSEIPMSNKNKNMHRNLKIEYKTKDTTNTVVYGSLTKLVDVIII